MTLDTVLSTLWTVMNSPAAIATMAGAFLWVLNRIYAAKPALAAYEGAIISAIKFAEKEIPDDTANKGLARLDTALRYVLNVYEQATGKKADEKTTAEIKNAIQVAHADLEAAGNL